MMHPFVKNAEDEQAFLASYSQDVYDRPSVTSDIVVFSIFTAEHENHRKDSEPQLHLLLVKRGEHPFKNHWALPGGFLKADETIEECAMREIEEETHLKPNSIMPVGVFSKPDRDPRGRIISHAFASIVSPDNIRVYGGGDAECAQWFNVSFESNESAVFTLLLTNDETVISVDLQRSSESFGFTEFTPVSQSLLAFDHASIIASSLALLRNQAENMVLAFDFLPKTFTLASLQRHYEMLTGTTMQAANFRRKIAHLVCETDMYTEGAGHRPARLFKKR